MDLENRQNDQTEKFIDLLNIQQRKIYAFIISLVGNYNDADDIMQETARTMWQKFDDFQQGTDFLAWSRTIAYYRILEYRNRHKRDCRLFQPEIFEALRKQAEENFSDSDHYRSLLTLCLKKLKDGDLNLIYQKYSHCLSIKEISRQYGRSTQAVYRSIGRIHDLLRRCIKQKIHLEGQL